MNRLCWEGILACALMVCGSVPGTAQISPGPLANVHSQLTGPEHCTDCHDAAKRPPEFKCLDCHRDIRQRLDQKRGLHPSLVGDDRTGRTCVKCHSDHNGPDFAIIHWDTPVENFDHRRTGYVLEGKHAGLGCRTCHQPAHIAPAARQALTTKDLSGTYLGLSRVCAECHADAHHGQLTSDCTSCHDSADWKNAATRFDHKRARFNLTGAHEKVACVKCHSTIPDAKPFVKYKGIPFEDCQPCHADPHKGAFRGTCRSCHTSTVVWPPTKLPTGFDHSQTRYPLLGKHAGVSCVACHPGGDFKRPLKSEHCSDCHKNDPHQGEFAARPDLGGDCAACHRVEGFKPSSFGVSQHATTKFPLHGRHVTVPCAKCHAAKDKALTFKIQNLSCAGCHQDIHGGQFSSAPYQNRCDLCHNDDTFKPSTFTVIRHAESRYPLTGAHRTVACGECHRLRGGGGASTPVPYRFEDRSCTTCHEDPHQGQFAERMKNPLPDGSPGGCTTCHEISSWLVIHGFDHDATAFPLEGAHRKVSCAQCHKPAPPASGIRGIKFASAPRQCSACHEDVHGTQFSLDGKFTDCRRCHGLGAWKSITFDHNTQSTFKLEGAHRTVSCERCHKTGSLPNGIRGVIYKSTPSQCSACHGDIHGGQFATGSQPTECDRCHQPLRWKPSTFDHNTQSAFKLDGAHRNVRCPLCHTLTKEVAGRVVVFYKPTPHACSACHGTDITRGAPC